ncbi:MAG: hypothetical protein J6D03_09605 [Clostridia bacterium]|nr:hypothetical protein [Clostridia bacterium]
MNYFTLSKKPTIVLKSNAEGNTEVHCKDLLASNNKNMSISNFDYCIVSEYYIGRPDLISFAFYGTDIYGDVICKVNDISNPFELNYGDVLLIPSIYDVGQYVDNCISDSTSDLIREKDTIESMSNDAYKKLKNESRSPNELLVGQSNYTIDRSNHLVFY